MIHGFFIIDKPIGPTSHDVVKHIRAIVDQRRVGHAGTLDPFASGILIVAVGQATRLLEYVHDLPKTYLTTIVLGARSTTDDRMGEITPIDNPSIPTLEIIQETIKSFIGQIEQIPPAYAAIKVQGKKLYEYAREGTAMEVPARSVTIHNIEIVRYEFPELELLVHCSTGTYIRALARDVGESLGVNGYASTLRRTAIGNWNETNAIKLENITKNVITEHLYETEKLIQHLPNITLSYENVAKFKQGRAVEFSTYETIVSHDRPISVFNENKKFVGIGKIDQVTSLLSPLKVLN